MSKPVIVLIAAMGACLLILSLGPALANMAYVRLPPAIAGNMAIVESLFCVTIYGALLAAGAIGAALSGHNGFALGRHRPLMLVTGTLVGVAGMMMAATIVALTGPLRSGGPAFAGAGMLAWGFALIVLQAGSEEVFFRGWLQRVLQDGWGDAAAVGVTATVFAALHLFAAIVQTGNSLHPLSLLNLLLGGLLFGLVAVRGGGIAGALGLHVAWNATEQLLLGLMPNPGIGRFGALVDLDLVGPAIRGGSAEGLNASIAMTLVLAALVLPLLALPRRSRPAFAM